ncbi:MAG: hypothetical protein NTX50_21520 [Candidatus Sumerlaeota bacterium]|nr:hypothetical protein [Candidatus Sumerlaeota bacterium]
MSNDSKTLWIVLAIAAAVVFMAVMFVGLVGMVFWLGFSRSGVPQAPMSVAAPTTQAAASQAVPQTVLSAGINPSKIMDKAQALRAESCPPNKFRSTGGFASATSGAEFDGGKGAERGEYVWCEFSEDLLNPDELIQALQTEVEKEIGNVNGVITKRIPGADPQSWRDKICYKPGAKYTAVGGFYIEYTKDNAQYSIRLNLRKEQAGGAYPYRLWICVSEAPPAQPKHIYP